VVKGLIARGAVLYGYDGECQFGGSHSVTFVRQEETRGACPACGEIGKVLEGSKCANCGNPVEAVTVVADHHAEKSVREMLLPGRRNKRP